MSSPRWSLVVLALLLAVPPRLADAAPAADRTLSPYFVVEGAKPGGAALPLERTHADIHIAGVIADVTVQQSYRNDGDRPISARYVFPASTRAAVHGMKMTIGSRVIVARIKEREAARAEYEAARRDGKTASLLEEDRPNVFSMSVANILPGDRIEVELRYTELLVPTDGTYELVYPTVVGPRYVGDAVDPGAAENQFLASAYRRAGLAPGHAFGLKVSVAAGMPIQALVSPSHAIRTTWVTGRGSATVALDPADGSGGDRDFVLRYRLGGTEIASGLLLHQGKDESFFLMLVQPPQRPAPDLIPPREYVFILDVSGSMHGFPLDTSKQLMRGLLGRLRPGDRFNVLLFSGGSDLYAERSVPATAEHIDAAIGFVGKEPGGGGTELLPALQRAMALPREAAGVARSFVVVTDGYIAEEPDAFAQVRDHLGEASVFAFGIGSSVNRHLIDGLARAGQGEPFVVLDPSEAAAAATRFGAYIESPVLTSLAVSYDGFEAYDVEPTTLPDVFAQRPVVVFGKWRGARRGKITLTGVSGRGRFVNTFDVGAAVADAGNGALAHLWARERIARLADFGGDTNRAAVVELGLRYNLLTPFTSFIAVHQVARASGPSLDVDQPLAMPMGVSDEAIGMESGPEPSLPILLGFVALAAALQFARRARARSAA
jgi:Ca-activated chloride channel homolog